MPQYRIPQQAVGLALIAQGEAHFSGGESAAGTADKSVRLTVFLAAVLFLVGIGSRSYAARRAMGWSASPPVLLAFSVVQLLGRPGSPS